MDETLKPIIEDIINNTRRINELTMKINELEDTITHKETEVNQNVIDGVLNDCFDEMLALLKDNKMTIEDMSKARFINVYNIENIIKKYKWATHIDKLNHSNSSKGRI
tara:strand:+ start:1202 stop:1525 length:324 start_codon:yes stop_codon:yes gene_type:complete